MGRKPSTTPGVVIGPYTAVAPTGRKIHGGVVWQWRCECGEARYAVPARLAADNRRSSLACPHAATAAGRPANDVANVPCGMLTPVEVARRERNGEYVWRCECECGAVTTVRASRLKSLETTMCPECAAQRRKTPDGYRLRDARLAARLTMREVAALCGVSHQRVHLWENQIRVRECEHILARIAGAACATAEFPPLDGGDR